MEQCLYPEIKDKKKKKKSFIEHEDSLEKPVRELKLRQKLDHRVEVTSGLC